MFAYRFNGRDWLPQQVLLPDEGSHWYHFGGSVAISADRSLVGLAHPFSGCFFAFDGRIWVEQQRLPELPGARRDQFQPGSVALTDQLAFIGAPFANGNGSSLGATYILRYNGSSWRDERKVISGGGGYERRFGYSLAAIGDSVIIGAPGDEDGRIDSRHYGSAYALQISLGVGDWDTDGTVTAADSAALVPCVVGPVMASSLELVFGCQATFDFDSDDNVDLADVAAFQRAFGCP